MKIELAMTAVLASLHARCFEEPWHAKAFGELLKLDNVFGLIEHEGQTPAGFIVVRVAADEAEILTLGVLPERRRHGLARELVRRSWRQAFDRGARTLFLEVSANNAPARTLYRHLGFEEVGRRTGYYGTCDSVADALVLRRVLPIPEWESA
jgi:ribosomal-protein-alanine N-acetyltransferase